MLAYHDRSDGGLFVTLAEMAFAGRTGLRVDLAPLAAPRPSCRACRGALHRGAGRRAAGARAERDARARAARAPRRWPARRRSARRAATDACGSARGERDALAEPRVELQRLWSETTCRMQALRDNPECATRSTSASSTRTTPASRRGSRFDPGRRRGRALRRARRAAARRHPARAGRERPGRDGGGVRPRRLRGDRRAHERRHRGPRRRSPASAGFAACGGFSYGDVLGGGEGWAKSILFNARARDEFARVLRAPGHLRARRLQRLPDDGGAQGAHPRRRALAALRAEPLRAVRGAAGRWSRSRRARRSSSPAWRAAASRSSTAHGEGRALFDGRAHAPSEALVAARFVDNRGEPTERYPRTRTARRGGITGADDARRPLHDPDAAPGARVPHRADVLAPGRLGRGQPLDAALPQRAVLGRLSVPQHF